MATSQQGEARTRAGRLCWQLTAPELVWTALGRPSSGLQGIRFTAPGIFPWRPQLMCPLKRSRGVGRSLPCNRAPVSHRVKLRFTQADSVQRTLKFPSESSVRKKKKQQKNKQTPKPVKPIHLPKSKYMGCGFGEREGRKKSPCSHLPHEATHGKNMVPATRKSWSWPWPYLSPPACPQGTPLSWCA